VDGLVRIWEVTHEAVRLTRTRRQVSCTGATLVAPNRLLTSVFLPRGRSHKLRADRVLYLFLQNTVDFGIILSR
jgi:hypothetical protein